MWLFLKVLILLHYRRNTGFKLDKQGNAQLNRAGRVKLNTLAKKGIPFVSKSKTQKYFSIAHAMPLCADIQRGI